MPSISSGNIAEWGGGYMSHKQEKGLQDAIFWTCNHNLPTTAYDCMGSVKKKWAQQQPSKDGGGGQGALSLTVDLLLLIARVRKWAFSCIYTDAPQTPTPAPMDSSNAGLIQTALVRLHRYQNKTKRHESATVTNRVGWG